MSYTFKDSGFTSTMLYADSPEEQAARDRAIGRRRGYPECCIEEFVADTLACRLSCFRRGVVPDGAGGWYVPCSACRAMRPDEGIAA